MQKLFMSGCDTLQSLLQSSLKRPLQQLMCEFSHLRGYLQSVAHQTPSLGMQLNTLQ